jgi:hypothetical protein
MARDQELMERLAAADPLRDGEQLTPEDQREADALLARVLATPVESLSRLPRRMLAVAGAACVAVAVLVAVDLLDTDTQVPGVVDRAVAAVTRAGAVYHVVELTTARVSPETDSWTPRDVISESWYTSDGRLHRTAFAVRDGRRGRLMEDFAGQRLPGRRSGSALRWDGFTNTISESGWFRSDGGVPSLDSSQDPGAQLRALEEQGRLRVDGTTSVDGRRAYRLVSDTIIVDGNEIDIEFTVDAETYLPLSQRAVTDVEDGPTLDIRTRYRVYERLPLDDTTDRLLALDPHPGAKCSEFAHELTEERDLGFPNPCAAGDR